MKLSKDFLRSNVIVHVARSWERLRLYSDNKDFSSDNIESVNEIVEIAERIMENKIVLKLLESDTWDWFKETGNHFSDVFFEELAIEEIYKQNDIELKYISEEYYIFWDNKKDEPLEGLVDTYHYTSIIDLVNQDLHLGIDESIIQLTDLPFAWQIKINNAIKKLKEDGKDS